jgi:KaiC/GvpD/RAD55 family RecA-like ATPase
VPTSRGSIYRHEAIPGLRHIFGSADAFPDGVLLLTGPAGSGKTMYCMQFLREGAADGEQCVYVSLDPLFTEERFKKAFQSDGVKFMHAFKKGSHDARLALQEIRAGLEGLESPRVVVDSITRPIA